jgi:2-polyprenyl-3-methyl-5-hydroxy-6-metoxy-1,4-benzoquinol methylase
MADWKLFNQQLKKNSHYAYTKGRLSSEIAQEVITSTIFDFLKVLKVKKILDVGCGDGYCTELLLKLNPEYIWAIDPAEEAIKKAKINHSDNRINYLISSLNNLNEILNKFHDCDIIILRGVIHHLDEKELTFFYEIIKSFKVPILITEPNGLNFYLKINEKFSKYHILHKEKSYTHYFLRRKFRQSGYKEDRLCFMNTTPFFCPDILAKITSYFHPYIVKIPIIRSLLCGNFCALYIKKN